MINVPLEETHRIIDVFIAELNTILFPTLTVKEVGADAGRDIMRMFEVHFANTKFLREDGLIPLNTYYFDTIHELERRYFAPVSSIMYNNTRSTFFLYPNTMKISDRYPGIAQYIDNKEDVESVKP